MKNNLQNLTEEQRRKILAAAEIVDGGDMAVLKKIIEFNDIVDSNVEKVDGIEKKVEETITNAKQEIEAIKQEVATTLSEVEDGETPSEEELLTLIKPLIPKVENGKTPTKKELLSLIEPLIPIVENINPDDIVSKVLGKIELPKYKETILDDAGQIRDKLETLKEEDRLDASAIKNLPQFIEQSPIPNGGGWRNLFQLHDVSIASPTNNQVLKYNSTTRLWEAGTASGGSTTFIGLTDVPATYTGQALKVVRVNAGETALEFTTLAGGGDALKADPLSQFASTTSLQLAGVISDETGSGSLVFATSPTLVTPVLGVATATSINKVAFTAPATSATIVATDGTTTTLSGGTHSGTNTGDQDISGKANSSGALTQFIGNGNWKVWYSDGSGDVQELALGADGTFLKSNGAAIAPSFATPSGSGDMVLASAQTNSGVKTFLDTTMKLRNVANTFDAYFVNTVTADRIITIPDRALTLDNITTASTTNGTGFLKGNGSVISFDNSTYLTSVGTGTINELTYWSGANTLGTLAVATYPSLTEISYVKGVTSAIQTQLNAKLANVVEDTTPQLGGSLDVNGQKIVSVSNGNIDIEPHGTGNVLLGNFTFDADQTVGVGQDNYILTYDNATGLISLEAASGGGANTALSNLAAVAINTSLISDTNNTDDLGSTGVRWKKTWTVDLESTNMPTVGGTAILSSLTAPQFTTLELGHASDTTLSRVSAGVVAIEGVNIETTATMANTKKTSVGFTLPNSASCITGKVGGFFTCPYAGTISAWNFVVDAGTATVKVWKIATGTAKPTSANSINTSGVAISTGTAIHSTTTSDFTSTTVTANDIFAFNIEAISGVSELTFNLEISKT